MSINELIESLRPHLDERGEIVVEKNLFEEFMERSAVVRSYPMEGTLRWMCEQLKCRCTVYDRTVLFRRNGVAQKDLNGRKN